MSTLASGSAGADTLSLEDSAPTPLAGPVSGTAPATRQWPTPAAGAPPPSAAKTCPRCRARYPEDFRVCPIDAAELVSSDADADPLLGAVLGGTFQVLRGIGEGGMARVYEARHLRLPKRRFAVKVLHPEYAQQPAIVTRFQREAEAASGIGHPNVVDVFDVGRAPDGRPFLASELLDGSDFSVVLDERGRVPVPYAVHVARQVCQALGAAHALGIVHRDVKPENVFLVGGGDRPFVKVLDFGISKIDDGGGGASLTRTGVVMGTPGYMAPEQARGAKVDHRVDVYGVGAMLYRALTGQLPFDGEEAAEVIARVLTEDPRRPRDLAPEIPGALELVVQRAMAKDPAARHASMAELDDALAAFDAEPVVPTLLPTPSPRGATLAVPTRPAGSALRSERDAREASRARPLLVGLGVTGLLFGLGVAVDVAVVVLQYGLGDGEPLPPGERQVVAGVLAALAVTPAVFLVRAAREVWGNTARAVAASQRLFALLVGLLFPYALLSLALRLATHDLPHPAFGAVPAAVAVAAAVATAALQRRAGGGG